MARFNLNDLLNYSRFEDFFRDVDRRQSGHDHMNGTTGGNVLCSQAPATTTVAGMAGNDMLNGGTGNDKVWGGSGNDDLSGGNGNDLLVGGFGADKVDGGSGNDTLLTRSDAGEMVAAKTARRSSSPPRPPHSRPERHPDRRPRRGHFPLRGKVNGKDEIVAKTRQCRQHHRLGGRHRREQRGSRSLGRWFRQRHDHRLQPRPGRQDPDLGAHRRGQVDQVCRRQSRRPHRLQPDHRHQPAGQCRRA